ncbi:hypothetical protein P8631_16270, partial [Guyparkeria sp. 1SP6A2]|nr:hypothetical protein [Guyparkeria sp. 1SP6A2]
DHGWWGLCYGVWRQGGQQQTAEEAFVNKHWRLNVNRGDLHYPEIDCRDKGKWQDSGMQRYLLYIVCTFILGL